MGSLTYEEGHSHCEGRDASLNGKYMVSLFVTKNLEVTMKTFTVWEGFNSIDILVMENGAFIPLPLGRDKV